MSEVPELRAAVRASAERRSRRRRWRSANRVAPAMVVLAACVVALVVSGSPEADHSEVAATPSPVATSTATDYPIVGQPPGTETRASALASIASVYRAFRRPPRASDRLRGFKDTTFTMRGQPATQVDRANARRLATSGEHALYAAPALQNGHTILCTYMTRRGRPASAGCGVFDPAQVNAKPRWSKTFYRPAPVYALLVPDGTKTVDVHLKSGKVLTKPVQDNGVIFAVQGLRRIVWHDANGTQHSTRAAI